MPKAMLYQILDAAVHSANVLCLMRRKYHDYFFIIEVKKESTRGVKLNIKAIKETIDAYVFSTLYVHTLSKHMYQIVEILDGFP